MAAGKEMVKDALYKITGIIDRHRIAFVICLTIFLIGVFSGTFYYLGQAKATQELITQSISTKSVLVMFLNVFFPNLIILLLIMLCGSNRYTAFSISPIILCYKGYECGNWLAQALSGGVKGIISLIIVVLPVVLTMLIIYVFASMICMSSCYIKRGKVVSYTTGYINFFVLLMIITLIMSIYRVALIVLLQSMGMVY